MPSTRSVPFPRMYRRYTVPFIPSLRHGTLGVEWELVVVDKASRELTSHAPAILADLADTYGAQARVKAELMQNTVEVVTGICTTVDEAASELADTAAAVCDAADKYNAKVMCSGTHPFSRWWEQDRSPSPRYDALAEQYAWNINRMQIFGLHVHVGLQDQESVIPLMYAVESFIPCFLALSASSPYWLGSDTGMASARAGIYEGMMTPGLPPRLSSWGAYEELVGTLSAGDAHFDLRRLWWDVRPHPDLGTIEIRAFDGASTLNEVCALVALVQCVVERAVRQNKDGTLPQPLPDWLLRENKERASRWGIDAPLTQFRPQSPEGASIVARKVISELVDELAPIAEELECPDELAKVWDILKNGTSSERQRAVAQRHNGDLSAVVDHLSDELRQSVDAYVESILHSEV